ncbi:MAG: hypothetical protein MUD16_00260 [Desulfobacterales bacterium]|nr:hypothetical protein [Desulfobacterales bacterium]
MKPVLDSCEHVGGLQLSPLPLRQLEDREAFRQSVLHSIGRAGGRATKPIHGQVQQPLGLFTIRGIEDVADLPGHRGAHVQLGHVRDGVASQVAMAAVPGDAVEGSLQRGFEPLNPPGRSPPLPRWLAKKYRKNVPLTVKMGTASYNLQFSKICK